MLIAYVARCLASGTILSVCIYMLAHKWIQTEAEPVPIGFNVRCMFIRNLHLEIIY